MRWFVVSIMMVLLLGGASPTKAEAPLMGQIQGTVYLPDGVTTATGVEVELWRWEDGWYYEAETEVEEDGTYQLDASPGFYRVEFWPEDEAYDGQYYAAAYLLDEARTVVVKEGEIVSGIDARLSMGGDIEGQVMAVDGHTPAAEALVNLYQWDDVWFEWAWFDDQPVDETGRFGWSALTPGRYLLSAEGDDTPETFYDGVTDLEFATEIRVEPHALTPSLTLTLRSGGIVQGYLTAADGSTPVPEMEIGFYPAQSWAEDRAWVETTTDEVGYYEVILPAGQYRLVTAEDSPAYLPYTYPSTEQFFTVTDAQTTTINPILTLSARLTGKLNSTDGPVINSTVSAYRWVEGAWRLEKSVDSGPQGEYTITSLPAGTYRVGGEPKIEWTPHLLASYYPDAPDVAGAADITVLTGTTVSNINLLLDTGGLISGHVFDPQGKPLGNVRVTPYQATRPGQWEKVCCTMQSDDMGNYITNGLPAGVYRLEFQAERRDGYVGYYQASLGVESATDIPLQLGGTIPNIDMRFQAAGVITGRVFSMAGQPLRNIQVTAYRSGGNWTSLEQSNSAGEYRLNNVPPGDYTVRFFDPQNNYFEMVYSQTITLQPAQHVGNINATLAVGGEISGQVTSAAEGIPLGGINVSVYQHDGFRWVYLRDATTAFNGTYHVSGLKTGAYRLLFDNLVYPDFGPLQAKFALQAYGGGITLGQGQDVAVVAGETSANINQTLPYAVTVGGRATTVTGEPLAHAVQVLAHAFNGVDWSVDIEAAWLQRTTTDGWGRYQWVGLPAGTYRLGFYDWDGESYITSYYGGATTVGQATEVIVEADRSVTDLDVLLTAGTGQLHGTVSVAGSGQLGEAEVTAYLFDGTAWEPQFVGYTYLFYGGGAYELFGLGTGQYRLKVEGILDGARVVQYYPSGTTLDEAETITLQAGQHHGPFDITLGAGEGERQFLPLVIR